MNRSGELGELSVSWFSFESDFSQRILLCNNSVKVLLNSLWDHYQVTKSLLDMPWETGIRCQGCCNCGMSVAAWGWFEGSFLVWLLMGKWVLVLRFSGLHELVRTNLWSFIPPNFCELQNMPVSAIHYYPALKCRWSLHWTIGFKCFHVTSLSSFWCVKVPLWFLCLKLPRRLKSPQGSFVLINALLCQSCVCGLSSPWGSLSLCWMWGCSQECLSTSRHSQLPGATFWISELFFPTSAISFSFTSLNKYINVFSAWTVVFQLIDIFSLSVLPQACRKVEGIV